MWIIKKKSTNELHLWLNKREDNFQMFLPVNLQTTQDDLELYLCPDQCCMANQVNPDEYLPEVENGEVVLKQYSSVDTTDPENPVYSGLVATYPTQLVAWPYDNQTGEHTVPDAVQMP
jgi:hypothetical protein